MEYKDSVEPQIKRIFERLTKRHKDFDVGVSMGIACTKDCKEDYDTLFTMADTAMYTVKRESKNSYCFYNPTMTTVLRGEE